MNNSFSQLSKAVFKKERLSECSLEQIQELTNKYPFFAAGHLLHSAKLKETGSADLNDQLQKTSLYFNNPFWLDLLINPEQYQQDELDFAKKPVINETPAKEATREESVNETESEDETDEMIHEEEEGEMPLIKVNLPDLNMKVSDEDELPLSFEPYHRVDYFASQGIKVDSNFSKEDKLGQKLKSFTDWLKVMKKLPESDKLEKIDAGSEIKIINLAQHSLEEREVVTEAMAEVWEKQGNKEKALETYQKLSLLNPAKSTYFASKIEQLKK